LEGPAVKASSLDRAIRGHREMTRLPVYHGLPFLTVVCNNFSLIFPIVYQLVIQYLLKANQISKSHGSTSPQPKVLELEPGADPTQLKKVPCKGFVDDI
jgi:hypothetical protein